MGVLQKPIADLNNLSANVLKLAVTMRAANTFEQIARFFRPEIFSAKNFSAENFSAEPPCRAPPPPCRAAAAASAKRLPGGGPEGREPPPGPSDLKSSTYGVNY